MKFILKREQLLKPLQQVNSLVSGRPLSPILAHLLIEVTEHGVLMLTSCNLDMEIVACISLTQKYEPGVITISARKFLEICRNLPGGIDINISLDNEKILLYSGNSRFLLSTLSVDEFPNFINWKKTIEFLLPQITLKHLIETTEFSMAYKDVRHCFNGMMFENYDKTISTVATDGHRLAVCSISINQNVPNYSVIIPRKGILELFRLLDKSENNVKIQICSRYIRVYIENFIFTSKLIDGTFPDYRRVIPVNADKELIVSCEFLKQALIRVSILSNEKCRSVRLYISTDKLKITSNNSEYEEAVEELNISYIGRELEIAFNVNYLLDVLNTLTSEKVRMLFTDALSGVQFLNVTNKEVTYVIMPMRI